MPPLSCSGHEALGPKSSFVVPRAVHSAAAAVFWSERTQVLQKPGINREGCCALCGSCALACFEGEVMDLYHPL